MDLFPIFLKIAGRPCVVIGAGNLAEAKIDSLLAAHAKVMVIAPEAVLVLLRWRRQARSSGCAEIMSKAIYWGSSWWLPQPIILW
ncbi:NAD(P)-dependent oxidoreductase [Tunturiibacter empetritectus]|uniref:NAD(P)-dependent oxidoreductase n=1 Tax=Tunturiibacter empetritectus TaxID=3069691 RepID=UPI003D9B7ABC